MQDGSTLSTSLRVQDLSESGLSIAQEANEEEEVLAIRLLLGRNLVGHRVLLAHGLYYQMNLNRTIRVVCAPRLALAQHLFRFN